MKNINESNTSTRIKVGIFTLTGLILIGLVTVLVNDRPYWWRTCQLVHINVEDATGLKMKSPVRSLGLEIGYLSSVELTETYVDLGICITAPVEVLPSTRAYIRGEGFLGDKFVELKPVKYLGDKPGKNAGSSGSRDAAGKAVAWLMGALVPSAHAQDEAAAAPTPPPAASNSRGESAPKGGRQIPVGESSQDVQALVNRVDSLVNEMTGLTTNLKTAINPEELRATMKQLNRTLENASKTLSPEGGLNQTAQRTLAKLEDAIEQLRDMLTRVNQGKGSIGSFLNDPTYAEETKKAIDNVNKLLNRANDFRFIVDVGGEKLRGYDGSRGWMRVQIWPRKERYYLLGLSTDPRGSRSKVTTKTELPSGEQRIVSQETINETGILVTGMIGQRFFERRLDLSIGAQNNDGTASVMYNFGPPEQVELVQLRADMYSRGTDNPFDVRINAIVRPFMALYLKGGIDSFRKVNGVTSWSYGAGIAFSDDDIKLLFAFF